VQIDISDEESGQVLKIAGALDIEAAPELRKALSESIEANAGLTLDLGAVDACDTAALQVLYSARKTANGANKPMRILGMSAAVADAAAALGLAIDELSEERVSAL
jgi:anti-anti-sigma factor